MEVKANCQRDRSTNPSVGSISLLLDRFGLPKKLTIGFKLERSRRFRVRVKIEV
jgi:hypothetical protein